VKLGNIVYVPPRGVLHAEAFMANITRFVAGHPLYLISDSPEWNPSRLIKSPEIADRRPAFAINNLVFLRAIQLARDAGLDFFFSSRLTAEYSGTGGMRSSGIVFLNAMRMASGALEHQSFGIHATLVLRSPVVSSTSPMSSKKPPESVPQSMADSTLAGQGARSCIPMEAERFIRRRYSCSFLLGSRPVSKCSRVKFNLGTWKSGSGSSAPSGTRWFHRSDFLHAPTRRSGIASSVTKSANDCCSPGRYP
jgi:hypothetical protein